MDSSSSSLLRFQSNPIHHTSDHPNPFDPIPSSHHPLNPSDHPHLAEFLTPSDNRSKPQRLPFPLPLPNFLIDPQDGQFTPYFDRSPASSPGQEYDDPILEFNHHSPPSSPMNPISPLRSRATSIALKKLMEIQAQKLMDISAAWKKKYPGDDVEFGCDAINACKFSSSYGNCVQLQHGHGPDESKENKFNLTVDLPTPQPPLPSPRHHRSISQKSINGFSSFIDRLSLNDYRTTRNDTHSRPPQKLEVESWKREVLESKLKSEATRHWIHHLPLPEKFEPIVDGVELNLTPSPI